MQYTLCLAIKLELDQWLKEHWIRVPAQASHTDKPYKSIRESKTCMEYHGYEIRPEYT